MARKKESGRIDPGHRAVKGLLRAQVREMVQSTRTGRRVRSGRKDMMMTGERDDGYKKMRRRGSQVCGHGDFRRKTSSAGITQYL